MAVLARGMSPPHFPIGPDGLRGDWTFGTLPPGQLKAEGFTVEAREVPHKGGRTYGYRVSDGHSVLTYIPDHCPTVLGPGPEGLGEYHPAALDLAAGADLLDPRRVPAGCGGARGSGVRPRGGGVRGRARARGPEPGGWRWPTTSRTGRTPSWTSWPPGSRSASGPRPRLPDVIVAAEGGILDL